MFQAPVINDHTNSLLENLEDDKARTGNGEETVQKEEHEAQLDVETQKAMTLLKFEDAPEYMKHNPFILKGYRGILNTDMCIQR